MPVEAIAAALLSALIHASWNAFLKGGRDRLTDLGQMAIGGIVFGATLAVAFAAPPLTALPYLAASCAIHMVYWAALLRGYAAGDMSHVYTIARGMAPLLVTLGAAVFAREVPQPWMMAGILLVSFGILSLGFTPAAPLRATLWALLTGVCIASYSLLDALGSRIAGDVLSYKGWGTIGTFLPILLFIVFRRGLTNFAAAGRGRWAIGLFAGMVSSAGFALILWAQMRGPIGPLTALREVTVVIGAAIAAIVLNETVTARRWLAAGVVATGVVLITLAAA